MSHFFSVHHVIFPSFFEVPRPRHRPDVRGLAFQPQRDRLVDERAGTDSVDLQALDAVLDQLIGRKVLGKLGGVDLARASFVAVLTRLAREGLVGVADQFAVVANQNVTMKYGSLVKAL